MTPHSESVWSAAWPLPELAQSDPCCCIRAQREVEVLVMVTELLPGGEDAV